MTVSSASKHVKFDEGLEDLPHLASQNTTDMPVDKYADISESDSDDDVPEEEGVSSAKNDAEIAMKIREDALNLEQKMLKEKRRKQNEIFKKQKEEKHKRNLDTRDDVTEKNELEEMPTEFFDKLKESNADNEQIKAMPKHINFNDIEIDDKYIPEVQAQLKKKKKNSLKKLRASSKKKGPVTVSVLSDISVSNTMAPKKEIKVTSTKDRWLKRKSLNRKK
ncbi:hypothetical protein Kpol_489p11 [Vanderwaltozyma polyspora DSM 70294]|uniref:Uncharacterized protein n=1 Tax=Vanderwaltozyma polyspora (strain ATCC 22028 / DSM 70294 / BCRC 21397 / CBS 2163 / NBRC 10782 / NRRL Y-8283 / UCD 57-17) TaxID=436907 RepID=A7TQ25_VANPO|nr:uncharacterized protein Kpol_489p11 [Vanderwaltozyma polyspora DSM 70294]EDO15630.1 hypothetical protein Kpol_489p11 [Vanderwaltozyma polyspora DSM 70294]